MRYKEITEAFDSQGVQWHSPTKATFAVNGVPYTATFQRDGGGGDYYEFAFTADVPNLENPDKVGRHDNIGGQGASATKVFGYAINCLAHFIKNQFPGQIGFVGFHDTGRDELYNRMALKLGAKFDGLGYQMQVKVVRGRKVFTSFDLKRTIPKPPVHGMPPTPWMDDRPKRQKSPEELARDRAEIDAILADLESLEGLTS
jgi:hypothetical protein